MWPPCCCGRSSRRRDFRFAHEARVWCVCLCPVGKLNGWLAAGAVLVLGVPSPAFAAGLDDSTELAKALKLQAELTKRLTGAPPVGAFDVSDGYVGGFSVAARPHSRCGAPLTV